MSSLSFLSVYLSGAPLILLLTVVCQAQYYDITPVPDYDMDYNATFEYSFYSNTSNEDLDRFSEIIIGRDDGEEEEEDTGGKQEEEEGTATPMATTRMTTTQVPTSPMRTPRGTTERREFDVRDAASLSVCPDIWMLLWTVLILIGLNTQQLQYTL